MLDRRHLAYHRKKLTLAEKYLKKLLEENGKPVLTRFEFFRLIRRVYRESSAKKLRLGQKPPSLTEYRRHRSKLRNAGVIGTDQDYGANVLRVPAIMDLPAENIACLVDPTCYVSHLSAMQRWGLTDRSPEALILTRPDCETVYSKLRVTTDVLGEDDANPFFPLAIVRHPPRVRNRAVRVHESTLAGASLKIPGTDVRLSTIGQTFLDMLQEPPLCGGMSHILDVWEEHAQIYLDEIVTAVDASTRAIAKIRAGYILEERLGLHHWGIEPWRASRQRGGSRRLDPTKDYASAYSEKWMISINV